MLWSTTGARVRRYSMSATWHCRGTCAVLERLGGDILSPGAKEKSQQDGRRGKTVFRIKAHTHQRCSESWNKPVCTPGPRAQQRLKQNCVWVSPVAVQVRSGLPRGQGLWMQQTSVWHKPFWRRSPLTHHRAARTYTRLGNKLWEGTNRTLCAPGPRRKEQWPHKRLTQTSPWVSRSLWQRCGSAVACWGLEALIVAARAWIFWGRLPLSSLPPP